MGLEPTVFGTTIRRVNQLHHTHHILICPSAGSSYAKAMGLTVHQGSLSLNPRVNEPGGIRTLDLRLRRPLLYPAELQTHLARNRVRKRVMGIEPTYPAWKAGVLPLNYTRM